MITHTPCPGSWEPALNPWYPNPFDDDLQLGLCPICRRVLALPVGDYRVPDHLSAGSRIIE